MIQRNIWQQADPGPPWHPRVQEHGCEGSERGCRAPEKIDLKIPLPYSHTSPDTHSISGPICFPVLHSSPLKAHTHHTHTPRSLHPRVNIISFSDRWDRSDLVENEATNLHPYYTVIHTQLQTCMWKLALSCTMLSRLTQTVTHLLNLHVKGGSLKSRNLQKESLIRIHPPFFLPWNAIWWDDPVSI